jgi:6-phosphofructokinase 1
VKIAISTGGGDAPGLNAVIRGAVLAAVNRGWDCVGIRRGFDGLLGDDEVVMPIPQAIDTPKRVPLDSDTIATARDIGIRLGD